LGDFGKPRALPHSGGWVLERDIPGFADKDAMGCYPIFACQNWSRLHMDMENLANEIVCLSLVTDPFGAYDLHCLRQCFPDVCFPFKLHYVVDLSLPKESYVHTHHRRNALKSLEKVSVECSHEPISLLEDWCRLYANLIKRHSIKGIAAFSERSFTIQLQVPGIVAFRALHAGATVGIILWYIQGTVAYYHLGAYDESGYSLRASFALFWRAIEYFAELGLNYLSLGAGAGITDTPTNGLNRFKKGWSTGTRPVYFCGRIFDASRYEQIRQAKHVASTTFFPAYRVGEYRE
jgi:hypothetical protein